MNIKIKKVIYFLQTPLTKRDYDRFGLGIMKKFGFEIAVFDFSPMLYPHLAKHENNINDLVTDLPNLIKKIDSDQMALRLIQSIEKNSFIISILPINRKTINSYLSIITNKIDYALLYVGKFPTSGKEDELIKPNSNSYYYKKIIILIIRLFNNQLNKLKLFIRSILGNSRKNINALNSNNLSRISKEASFIILSGSKYFENCEIPIKKSQANLFLMHTLDYDNYLIHRSSQKISNTAVFIGPNSQIKQAGVNDNVVLGLDPPILDPEQDYFSKLRAFFDLIESILKVEVIIAAHPRSSYSKQHFGRRKIIRNRTCELIRDSKVVITHCSTAINYSILFKKPAIFITQDLLIKSRFNNRINSMAENNS